MKELKNCFDYIAELDNHYSLAMYRRTLDVYTEPRIDETKNSIEFTELTHPLISDAIANDFSLSQNILLTGSNASGKSTFMKAIAINLILAKRLILLLQPSLYINQVMCSHLWQMPIVYYLVIVTLWQN